MINLPSSTERRERISAQLDRLGLEYEITEAVNGHKLTDEDWALYRRDKRQKMFGKDLTIGEIGCYLSHYRLWERIVREDLAKGAIILEDDVVISDDLPQVLDSLSKTDLKWEVLRLCGIRKRKYKTLEQLDNHYRLVRLNHVACGAAGYWINKKGASRLLPICREIIWPVDIILDRYWKTGLRILAIQPYVIDQCQNDVPSDIDQCGEQRKALKGKKNLSLYFRKRLRRLNDTVHRTCHNFIDSLG
ncbi:glycosyltransferase family 25 protein [Kiloniella sp. b19]|uniref:glycosyltransferase family 25 protein n=1 Tax=Kiloniella sp. GXU_MW_B19 TaxID=3141326 RepID=UPI0031E0FAC5